MTYERDMKNQIKKIVTHIEHRTAFTKQHKMVPIIHKTAQGMVNRLQGCNSDRTKRLSLEKEIKMVRILSLTYCK